MKVYAGTTEYNSHLVGKIYSSGKVYKYKNGEEVLWGIVRDNRFFSYDKNYDNLIYLKDNFKQEDIVSKILAS